MPTFKCLVVDDSRAIQSIIKRALEKSDQAQFELRMASSGDEALSVIEGWSPDLILTDWHMPGMTGLELVQTVRQLGLSSVKVGFVTTEKSEKHIEEALGNGASFLVSKPFDSADLCLNVHKALGLAGVEPQAPPVADDAITRLLSQSMVFCEVTPTDPVPIERLVPPYVFAVYSAAGSKAVDGVCLLNLNAAAFIGGSLSGVPESGIHRAISDRQISKDVLESSQMFLSDIAALLGGDKKLKMSSCHLVQKPFEKLYELMRNNYNRADFAVSCKGFEGLDGFISVLVA
jgi:CheY-like chemotaxis protein